MTTNQTFTMIKPNAVEKGHTGAIIDQIIKGGYRIIALKYVWLSQREAEKFYEIHKERPFFAELVAFMSRSPIVAIALEKENAVEAFREFIGATDPAKAAEGTIRAKYGESVGENAIHGSDSNENAQREIGFFFSGREVYTKILLSGTDIQESGLSTPLYNFRWHNYDKDSPHTYQKDWPALDY